MCIDFAQFFPLAEADKVVPVEFFQLTHRDLWLIFNLWQSVSINCSISFYGLSTSAFRVPINFRDFRLTFSLGH